MTIRILALASSIALASASSVIADPISGYVNADGSVAIPSSLYTVKHPKTGRYIIVFTTPMLPRVSCVITPIKGIEGEVIVNNLTETENQCSFAFHPYYRVEFDAAFSFMATPMSN